MKNFIKRAVNDVKIKLNQNSLRLLEAAAKLSAEDVEKALELGAKINFVDGQGRDALVISVLHVPPCCKDKKVLDKWKRTFRVLIRWGVNINLGDNGDQTPLHYASMRKNPLLVRCLVKRGRANTVAENNSGLRPIDYTLDGGHNDIGDYLREMASSSANLII